MPTERYFGSYFGEPWPSGVCDAGVQVPTPVGEICALCDEEIGPDHQGSFVGGLSGGLEPAHKECSLRAVLGGIGHHRDHPYWCGRMHDPDGGLSFRESALAVWEILE